MRTLAEALEPGGAPQRGGLRSGATPAAPRTGAAGNRGRRWEGHPLREALHVAIIMDGSGRWAEARGHPRLAGHRAGEKVVRTLVEAAPALGIGTLTLFAFSSDNWKRPAGEVSALLGLLRDFLQDFRGRAIAHDIRIEVLGRRDRLSPGLGAAVDAACAATATGHGLHLRLAIDYSGRDAILRAARRLAGNGASHGLSDSDRVADHDAFARALVDDETTGLPAPAVDLLVRTGGEQRLSDFLLWESAYAELYFTKKMWPDFGVADLRAAVDEFRARERRFGCLPGARS